MKLLVLFMGISKLLLAFQSNLCISFELEKVPQKYPQQLHHFLRGGEMILVMEKNSINQIYILECSPHQY
jgi:hypothetical protein